MTLTIIAGTHTFVDLTGRFRQAWARSQQKRIFYEIDGVRFAKRRFDRVEIQKDGTVIYFPSRIFPIDRYGITWSVSQPTGSGKTILAVYHLRKTWRNGGNIQANFSFAGMEHNKGKPKEEWKPSITSIEDLKSLRKCHAVVDDIKGTIEHWQAKEADVITLVANTGRKEGVDLDFTTQRVINYMPPNIRAVATGYEIPYITIRDLRRESPDGKGFPVEMEVFSLIPADSGDVFVGFGCLNKDIPDGKIICPTLELLESYKTMELATGLKADGNDSGGSLAPGWELECEAESYLKSVFPGVEIKHPKKKIFDLYLPTHAFDVIGTNEDGNGYTQHKTWSKLIGAARRTNKIPYLMFKWGDGWGFIRIKYDLPEGQLLNFSDSSIYNRIKSINSLKIDGNAPQLVKEP